MAYEPSLSCHMNRFYWSSALPVFSSGAIGTRIRNRSNRCSMREPQPNRTRATLALFGLDEPAKSKRGREEGDGTENVRNCRKLSFYENLSNCRDIFSRPLPAVPFWLSPNEAFFVFCPLRLSLSQSPADSLHLRLLLQVIEGSLQVLITFCQVLCDKTCCSALTY